MAPHFARNRRYVRIFNYGITLTQEGLLSNIWTGGLKRIIARPAMVPSRYGEPSKIIGEFRFIDDEKAI